MGRYESENCPICNKPLENGQEIVVCPQCGAPYHKNCYLQSGHCIFTQLHESGQDWKPSKTNADEAHQNGISCPVCGANNPEMSLFCSSCGASLTAKNQNQSVPPYNQAGAPFGGMPFGGMPFPGMGSPYCGVAPDEKIDDIPAEEYAAAIGRNTQYFLPRFKAISASKAKTINWSAFFFQGFYYLYRKMYLWGILLIIANLILNAPTMYMMYLTVSGVSVSASAAAQSLSIASDIFWFVSLGLNIVVALFTNTLYKSHLKKLIAETKLKTTNKADLITVLNKKGSVNTKIIFLYLIGYVVLSFALTYFTLYLSA